MLAYYDCIITRKRFVSFEIITYVQTGEKTASIFFFFWRSTNRTSSTSRIPPPPLFHPLLFFHDRTRAQHRNKTSDRYYQLALTSLFRLLSRRTIYFDLDQYLSTIFFKSQRTISIRLRFIQKYVREYAVFRVVFLLKSHTLN